MAEGGGGAGAEEESLVDLLNRATNPSNREDDLAAIAAFVDKIKADKDGPQMSVRLLAHKMQVSRRKSLVLKLVAVDSTEYDRIILETPRSQTGHRFY